MNSLYTYYLSKKGTETTDMVGLGQQLIMLDGNVLDALDVKITYAGCLKTASEFLAGVGKGCRVFYPAAELQTDAFDSIDGAKILLLQPEHVNIETKLISMRVRITTEYATVITKMGCLKEPGFDLILPEGVSRSELNSYLTDWFDKIDFVPLYHTQGWENAVDLASKNYKRFVGNVLKSIDDGWGRRFFHAHNPYFTAIVELTAIGETELEILDQL